MKKVQKYSLIVIIAVLYLKGYGQDFSPSQYAFTPFQTNPGGVVSGNEASFSFYNRANNSSTGQKMNAMMLTGIYPLIKDKDSWGGVGFNFYSNKNGEPSIFRQSGFSMAFAWRKAINIRNSLSIGAQAGLFQRRVNFEGLMTGSQWMDDTGFDPNVDADESFSNLSTSYTSVGAGLQWRINNRSGSPLAYAGIAGFNLNRPDQSFFKNNSPSAIKYVLSGAARVYKNDRFSIVPEFILERIMDATFASAGSQFNYFFESKPLSFVKPGTISLNMRYASSNALISSIQLHQDTYSIGFSYDYNLFQPEQFAGTTGTYELVFSIRKAITGKKKDYKVVEDYNLGQIRNFYEDTEATVNMEKKTDADLSKEQKDRVTGDNPEEEQTAIANGKEKEIEKPIRFALKHEFSFGFNEATLDETDKAYLDDLASLFLSNKNLKVEIVGHTDNVGTDAANHKLSHQRAKAVEEYLESKGIDKRRMKVRGMGSKEPLVPNDTEINRAKNRRVDFLIHN